MSGNLILSDEEAKLGQEALKTLRDLGGFVARALGSTPEDLIAYLGGDWLRVRRAENMARTLRETRKRLEDQGVIETQPAPLSVALPILQGAAEEDRDELVDLWARLLANAMDPKKSTVRYAFIDAVKRMDPIDALVLKIIYQRQPNIVAVFAQGIANSMQISDIAHIIGVDQGEVTVSIQHLHSLGLLRFDERAPDRWFVNEAFRVFMRAVS